MTEHVITGSLTVGSLTVANQRTGAETQFSTDEYRRSASPSSPLDGRWASAASLAGVAAVVSLFVLNAAQVPSPAMVALAFTFAFGVTVLSIGLYRVLAGTAGSALGLVATVANTVAAGQLLAMLLVQMAVKAEVPEPGPALTAIWLGVDVAWDLYVGTGTVLFAACMLRRPGFGAWLGIPGLTLAGLFLVLNIATFPTPPASAGLVDPGPIVGLWYLAVSVRLGLLAFRHGRVAQLGAERGEYPLLAPSSTRL